MDSFLIIVLDVIKPPFPIFPMLWSSEWNGLPSIWGFPHLSPSILLENISPPTKAVGVVVMFLFNLVIFLWSFLCLLYKAILEFYWLRFGNNVSDCIKIKINVLFYPHLFFFLPSFQRSTENGFPYSPRYDSTVKGCISQLSLSSCFCLLAIWAMEIETATRDIGPNFLFPFIRSR